LVEKEDDKYYTRKGNNPAIFETRKQARTVKNPIERVWKVAYNKETGKIISFLKKNP